MTDSDAQRSHARFWVWHLPAVPGALFVLGLLAVTVWGRIQYPYDLEWMEGGMLLHVLRVVEGQPLYVLPSSDFIPFIYPPLYHWLLGLVSIVAGSVDYLPGRALSLCGVLTGTMGLVVGLRREGLGWLLSGAVGCLFLSTYDETGAFFDLVRIDGILLALWGWSLVALRAGWIRLGGLLLVAAFATKHHAAAFGLPALIWLWRTQSAKTALRFVRWSVLPALGFVGLMSFEGDGLFLTYLLGVPAGHGIVIERMLVRAPVELATGLPVLGIAGLGGLVLARGERLDGRWYWGAQCGLAIALAMLMRGHHGGFKNVLIPGFWAVAMLGGLGLIRVQERFPRPWVAGVCAALLCVQGFTGGWRPSEFQPLEGAAEAGDRVVERLRSTEGPMLAPWQPWMAVQAGKEPAFHLIALWDIDHEWGPLRDHVDGIRDDVHDQKWGAILTANDRPNYGVRTSYRLGPMVRPAGKLLQPMSGWRVRPHRIFLRKTDAPDQ